MKLLYLKLLRLSLWFGILWGIVSLVSVGQSLSGSYDKYLGPNELNKVLSDLNKKYPNKTRIIPLAKSPGEFDLKLIAIFFF